MTESLRFMARFWREETGAAAADFVPVCRSGGMLRACGVF